MKTLKSIGMMLLLMAITNLAFSQQQKYYRVKIYTGANTLQQLSSLGVTIDHGDVGERKHFISEFSEQEFGLIKKSGVKYEVLIEDMSNWYQMRNLGLVGQEDLSQSKLADDCNFTTPANFTLGTMGGFYTYAEMLAVLDDMQSKFPSLITKKRVISNTILTTEGRPLYVVQISDNPNKKESETRVLYTALHHAREPLSSMQLIMYMWYLLENYNTSADVKNIVNNAELFFVPCVNPDGYIYNQTTNPNGGGMWRKNRSSNSSGSKGVDLNRNYGYQWGYDNIGSSNQSSSDTYRGPSAFSEPETQCIRLLCKRAKFTAAINNHSYSNVLIYPWGYKPNFTTPDQAVFASWSEDMTECNNFMPGTPNQTVGYTGNGVSDDWMYGEQTEKPKIIAFSPESGSFLDGFWPAKTKIEALSKKNLDMNLSFARQAINSTNTVAEKNTTITKITTSISPNPVHSIAVIHYQLPIQKATVVSNGKIEIYTNTGLLVKQISLPQIGNNVNINLSDLKEGIYYYRIFTDGLSSDLQQLQIVH